MERWIFGTERPLFILSSLDGLWSSLRVLTNGADAWKANPDPAFSPAGPKAGQGTVKAVRMHERSSDAG